MKIIIIIFLFGYRIQFLLLLLIFLFNYLFNLLFPILNSNSLKNTINDNI